VEKMSADQTTVKKIGRFTVLAEISRSQLATVYRTKKAGQNGEAVVKLLSVQMADKKSTLTQLEAQVTAVNQLNHPHIIPIYETGLYQGKLFLAMPYLVGGSLRDKLVDQGALSVDWLENVVAQIASALEALHTADIRHANLTPGNILFDDAGNAFVADFDLQQLEDLTLPVTALSGRLAYSSPEQFTDEPVNGRADQYSLAIILFEALTGQLPFAGNTTQLMFKQVHEPPPLDLLDNDAVAAVLGQALAKRPAERFDTMADFAAAWQQAALPDKTEALEESRVDWPPPLDQSEPGTVVVPGAGGQSRRRWPSVRWALFLFVLVLFAATGLAWQSGLFDNVAASETADTSPPDNLPILVTNPSRQATWQMGQESGALTSESRLPWPAIAQPLNIQTAGQPASLSLGEDGPVLDMAPASSVRLIHQQDASQTDQMLLEIVQGRILITAPNHEFTILTSLGSTAEVMLGEIGIGYAGEPFLFEVDCFRGRCRVTDLDSEVSLNTGERTYLSGSVLASPEPVRHDLYSFTTAVATATATPFLTATPTFTPTTAPTLTPTVTPSPTPSQTPLSTPTATATVTAESVQRIAPRITSHTCNAPGNFRQNNLITFTWTWADQLRGNEYLEVRLGPRGGSAQIMGSVGVATQSQGDQWSMTVAANLFFNPNYYDYAWEVALVQPGTFAPITLARSTRGCLRVEP
jgi:serine/threonine protein kinase